MTLHGLAATPPAFPSWVKRVRHESRSAWPPARTKVVFPHAGSAAVSYRALATALAAGGDTYILQYPQRADRLREPAPESLPDLARDLFEAGPWRRIAPLRLFGHSMGAIVAFEFARLAEANGVPVQKLWVSAAPPPSALAGRPPLPISDDGMLADIAELGGTDPGLLADDEFSELLITAVRADYRAFNRYHPDPDVRIRADIHALGGRGDGRVDADTLRQWRNHTTGSFELSLYDGGHFYVDDHIDDVAARVNADV